MKTKSFPHLMFGMAVGAAIAASVIGLVLVGIAVAVELRSGWESSLMQHPLFVSGAELISTSITLGLLLLATRFIVRK